MIRAGKLDQIIEIQAVTRTFDGYGMPVEAWAKVANSPTRAEYIPLKSDERMEMQKRTTRDGFKLRIRRLDGLTTEHRVYIDSKYANITGISDYKRNGRDQIVWCEVKE